MKHQGQQLFIESRARPLPRPRPRLSGELVKMWVGSETWGSPDLHPNPKELSLLLSLPATGTFKAKTLPCQSADLELEATPLPGQAPLALVTEEAERKESSSCSYQQINCLDSILR